jgi:hypothetical protein
MMEKFLKRKSTTEVESPKAKSSKVKSRKFDPCYIQFGFFKVGTPSDHKAQCIECPKTIPNSSLKPNKLKRHQETCHFSSVNKPKEYFERKIMSLHKQKTVLRKHSTAQTAALRASYKVALRVAKKKLRLQSLKNLFYLVL